MIKPLEIQLLQHGQNADRIVQLDQRCLFNALPISILVLNMPVNDEGLFGRLKDHLICILDGAEARYTAIHQEEENRLQRVANVNDTVVAAQHDIEVIEAKVTEFRLGAVKIMSNLLEDVEETLLYLSLSEEQESKNNLELLHEDGHQIGDIFTKFTNRIKNAL